ncbi:Troponin [Parelaphostrongylus tenuis]|uniref:Troponin n=1 Tax=Parelaphostrongylus tenuis TaxID=148309 RepID=A0AAD5QLP8_PARTN|nr:Troponin [Parelaphostrongylus tenuis]
MRSSFNTFNPSSYTTGVYNSSPVTRNLADNTPNRFELPSSPPGISFRNSSLSRDYAVRESDARNCLQSSSRPSSNRLSIEDSKRVEHAVSSRVTHNDETNALLERYGIRKTSVAEKHSQSYLKQRRQQSDSDGGYGTVRRKSDTVSTDVVMSGDGLNLSRNFDRKDAFRQPNGGGQEITHAEYLNRLLAAHNRVDDLLRSRGLSTEDESKYLRAWEEIPIIRENWYHRVRKTSNSSDSGLSTDSDSDRSHPDGAFEEHSVCEEFSKPELKITCEKMLSIPCCSMQSSHSCQVSASKTTSAGFSFIRKPSFKPISHVIRTRLPVNESVNHYCSSPLYANAIASYALKRKESFLTTRRVLRSSRMCERVKASITTPSASISQPLRKQKQQAKPQIQRKPAEQQKMVLNSLQPSHKQLVPSTAEISIQHCSFYEVAHSGAKASPEKNVQLNLRLTERAPKKWKTAITLPTTARSVFLHFDVPMKKKIRDVTSSRQTARPARAVGKLDRSITMDSPKDIRQHRKVNRLRIPDFFLHPHQEIIEEIKSIRNRLKKVQSHEMSRFITMSKQPTQPIRLVINRKKMHSEKNPVTSQVEGIYPFNSNVQSPTAQNPEIQNKEPLSSSHIQSDESLITVIDPTQVHLSRNKDIRRCKLLNLSDSTDRAATSCGATCYESKIVEFSHIDRLLVEHFMSSKHIPKPKALRQCAKFYAQQLKASLRHSTPPKVEFIRSRSPIRRPKQVHHHSSPPCLRRTSYSNRQFLKKPHRLNCPPLKKVDRSLEMPKVKMRSTKRWIPSWRKNSEEEVAEEHEGEEEEEVEEAANVEKNDSIPRRNKLKIHLDDDDTMTEAEKAMAASKRRQFEEQQNMLQEYDERRRIEREKEEEELKKLKEKQERRRLEREQEEREQAERQKLEEDRRRKEEEDRKAKQEEEKRKKDEEKIRRQQMSGAAFTATAGQGGRNFVIPKKSENRNDKFGNIVQAKQEMGMTKEQQEEAKRSFLASVARGVPISADLSSSDLKAKIKELHQRICKLEAEKYDLEKRHERQEYDLKELNERQRQVARNNALKKGIDPTDAASSKYPKTKALARPIDQRNITENHDKPVHEMVLHKSECQRRELCDAF